MGRPMLVSAQREREGSVRPGEKKVKLLPAVSKFAEPSPKAKSSAVDPQKKLAVKL